MGSRTKDIEDAAEGATGNVQPLLHKNSSLGNTSQLLTAGMGPLTIGYSPVNSFGNLSTAGPLKRGGSTGGSSNIQVLGDARSSSPTQVLGMYRSYSQGSMLRQDDAIDESMRMIGNSFGGPSSGQQRQPSYDAAAGGPNGYYPNSSSGEPSPGATPTSADGSPHFYSLLRRYKSAFSGCTFLLPGLKAALLEANLDETSENDESGNKNWVSI